PLLAADGALSPRRRGRGRRQCAALAAGPDGGVGAHAAWIPLRPGLRPAELAAQRVLRTLAVARGALVDGRVGQWPRRGRHPGAGAPCCPARRSGRRGRACPRAAPGVAAGTPAGRGLGPPAPALRGVAPGGVRAPPGETLA